MSSKSQIRRRTRLLIKAKRAERRNAESHLPASLEELRALIGWVEENLAGACDHTLRHTLEFIRQRGLDEERTLAWLRVFGGDCDCDVVLQVEDSCAVLYRRRTWLDRLLHQRRTPVCTFILLFTTLLVEAVLFDAFSTRPGLEAIGAFVWAELFVLVGILSNVVGGWVAFGRREFWGGRIGLLGIAVWFVTLYFHFRSLVS